MESKNEDAQKMSSIPNESSVTIPVNISATLTGAATPSYKTLLEALAAHDGLSASVLLESEAILIGEMQIGLMCDGDAYHGDVLLYTTLGRPAPDREPGINRLLLEANHLGIGTAGCTLGRHSISGVVTLCTRLPIPLTKPESFSDMLRTFYSIGTLWRNEISREEVPAAYLLN